MRILVYGFKPYGRHQTNISEKIIVRLKPRPGLVTKVLPVEFNQRQFIYLIKQTRPDAILGLGQHPRGTKIRIERRAQNQYGSKQRPLKRITLSGPRTINTTWRIKPTGTARLSYNAGSFVCNFSMYIVGRIAQRQKIPFAFLHIPKHCNLDQAMKFVEKQISAAANNH